MRGSISTSVTSTPYELQMVENSSPMAPAPMTTTDFGSFSCRIASQKVSTRSPSISTPGIDIAVAPVASTKSFAFSCCLVPSSASTSIVFASTNAAFPMWTSILFFFIRKPTPFTRRSDTSRLRLTAAP